MEEVLKVIKSKRYLAIAGLVLLFLGTITAYFKVTFLGYSVSLSLFKYWEGKVIIFLIIVNALYICKDYCKKYVPKVFETPIGKKVDSLNSKVALVPIGLVVLIAIYLTARSSEVSLYKDYIKYGIGFYLLWLGAACLVAHVFLYKGENAAVEAKPEVTPVQPTEVTPEPAPEPTPAEPETTTEEPVTKEE